MSTPKLDVAETLLHIAEQGADVHLMDWKAIVANAGFGGHEIKRLRRERDSLLSLIEGISRQTAEMVRAHANPTD